MFFFLLFQFLVAEHGSVQKEKVTEDYNDAYPLKNTCVTVNLFNLWYILFSNIKSIHIITCPIIIFFNFSHILGATIYSCQREHSHLLGKGNIDLSGTMF